MWQRFNIKFQLILFMGFVVTIVTTTTLLVILNFQKKEEMQNAVSQADTLTRSINNDLLKAILNPNADMFSDITFRLKAFEKINGMILYDENNNPLFRYGKTDEIQKKEKEIQTKKVIFEDENLFVKEPISAEGYTFGYSLVDVSLLEYKQKQKETTITILLIFPFALFIGFIISLFLSKSYTKPFGDIIEAMRKSDPTKNEIVELKTDAKNEIKELFDGFNSLMVQVYKSTQDIYLKAEHDKLKEIHKHTKESIEYASLIQEALIPENDSFKEYFEDYFIYWEPKDTVGGDIYLFNELRHKDESLFMFIDCTGHGVPGAFVTMLVKAIEAQIIAQITNNPNMDISPAWIMEYFNKDIKTLLKQENKSSVSNAGFDGGIIYYNKKENILKFCGAQTSLFYINEDEKVTTIKGDRLSVGYKKCPYEYEYKETIIETKKGMRFYGTTDGYLDQNGGEKDFPFGKKRFINIIEQNYKKTMDEQKNIFLNQMREYSEIVKDNERNDDITVVGFKI